MYVTSLDPEDVHMVATVWQDAGVRIVFHRKNEFHIGKVSESKK